MKLSKRLKRRTSSGKFIAEIDGLRFLAIAPVVVHHLAERIHRKMVAKDIETEFDSFIFHLIPNGPLGVEFFFVISGFVISMPIITNWIKKDEINFSFKKYFIRRLTRLEPPYLIVLFVIFLATIALKYFGINSLFEGTRSSSANISIVESLLASVFYLHGLIFNTYPKLNPPAWSLEIEFQFYIVAPYLLLMLIFLVRKVSRESFFILFVISTLILGKCISIFLIPSYVDKFLLFRYLNFFLLGFLACYLYAKDFYSRRQVIKFSSLIFVAGITIVLVINFYLKSSTFYLIQILTGLKSIGFLMIFTGGMSGGIGKKILQMKWISIVGGMCYSIYLLHLLILQFGVSMMYEKMSSGSLLFDLIIFGSLLLPVIFFVSVIFFILIERPCMDPKWPNKMAIWIKTDLK